MSYMSVKHLTITSAIKASVKAFAILMVSVSMSGVVMANEPAAKVQPDVAKGEALFNNGDLKRGIAACMGCHGANGVSGGGAYPKLAGQHAAYIVKQLKDYKSGKERPNAVMGAFAGLLSDEDMINVAAYLEKQTPGLGTAKNKASIELGQKIYRGGIAAKGVPACAGCHGPAGSGIPAQYPRLSGQWAEYTEVQLVAYRSGERKNSVQMSAIAAKMSDAEIKAVADYIAGLR